MRFPFSEFYEDADVGGERSCGRDYRGEIATGSAPFQGAGSRRIRGSSQTSDPAQRWFVGRHQISHADLRVSNDPPLYTMEHARINR